MLDQAGDFFKASGASLCMLYKEEMEMARRTEHFAGYQLLDLQDYPGQGTALVGILDAFMDSKGVITPEKFRETGGDVVPLICMDRYCWTWDRRDGTGTPCGSGRIHRRHVLPEQFASLDLSGRPAGKHTGRCDRDAPSRRGGVPGA